MTRDFGRQRIAVREVAQPGAVGLMHLNAPGGHARQVFVNNIPLAHEELPIGLAGEASDEVLIQAAIDAITEQQEYRALGLPTARWFR